MVVKKNSINMKKRIYSIIFIIALILLIIELSLRFVWGFCDAPLFIENRNYEYIAAPNQDRYRFMSHMHYNSFSQRSEEPDSTKKIVLGLGDSVLYGGTLVDQDSLATTIFTKTTGIQMLNISAGSWGPDNCAAYIQEKGLFNAVAIYLVVSSHDAFDVMDFTPVVGKHPNYPQKQYVLASWELLDRYLIPRISALFNKFSFDPDQSVVKGIQKKGKTFNPGFKQLKDIAEKNRIPLMVYLHAEISEIENKKYNKHGEMIIQWCKDNNVPITLDIEEGIDPSMYRDVIHLNSSGQRFLANQMINDLKFLTR